MAVSDRVADQSSGADLTAEIGLLSKSRLYLVEDKVKPRSASSPNEVFKRAPWKNLFYVEVSFKNDSKNCGRGTAFFTEYVRDTLGNEYAAFLTAGHVLFGAERVVLKHPSDMMNEELTVRPFIEPSEMDGVEKSHGWFKVCSDFKDVNKDRARPCDYGVIFVEKERLTNVMRRQGVSLDDFDLLVVQPLQAPDPTACIAPDGIPVFVTGYPMSYQGQLCMSLAVSEGNYQPGESLPKLVVPAYGDLPPTDAYTADTDSGMSGSPVILGEFPRASDAQHAQWKVIAIHVAGQEVDGKKYRWSSNVPASWMSGKGVNVARPITGEVLDFLAKCSPFATDPNSSSPSPQDNGLNAESGSTGKGTFQHQIAEERTTQAQATLPQTVEKSQTVTPVEFGTRHKGNSVVASSPSFDRKKMGLSAADSDRAVITAASNPEQESGDAATSNPEHQLGHEEANPSCSLSEENKISYLKQRIMELELENDHLAKKVHERENDGLQTFMSTLQEESYRQRIERLTARKEEAEKQMAEKEKNLKESEEARQDLQKRLDKKDQDLLVKDQQVQDYQKKLKKSEQELAVEKKKRQDAEKEKIALQERLKTLQDENEYLKALYDDLQRHKKDSDKRFALLEEQIEQLRNERPQSNSTCAQPPKVTFTAREEELSDSSAASNAMPAPNGHQQITPVKDAGASNATDDITAQARHQREANIQSKSIKAYATEVEHRVIRYIIPSWQACGDYAYRGISSLREVVNNVEPGFFEFGWLSGPSSDSARTRMDKLFSSVNCSSINILADIDTAKLQGDQMPVPSQSADDDDVYDPMLRLIKELSNADGKMRRLSQALTTLVLLDMEVCKNEKKSSQC